MTTETRRNAVQVEPLHLENARTWRGKAFPIGFQVKSVGDQTTPVTVEDGVQYLQDLSASGELTRLLREHGAVLFRGFGSPSAETFSKLVNAAERARNNTPYEQVGLAGKRSIQGPEVFTANEGPETQRFFLHNEVSKHFLINPDIANVRRTSSMRAIPASQASSTFIARLPQTWEEAPLSVTAWRCLNVSRPKCLSSSRSCRRAAYT